MLSGEYLYWTDWQDRSIQRVNKSNGRQRSMIVEHLPDLMGLKAVSVKVIEGQLSSCPSHSLSLSLSWWLTVAVFGTLGPSLCLWFLFCTSIFVSLSLDVCLHCFLSDSYFLVSCVCFCCSLSVCMSVSLSVCLH